MSFSIRPPGQDSPSYFLDDEHCRPISDTEGKELLDEICSLFSMGTTPRSSPLSSNLTAVDSRKNSFEAGFGITGKKVLSTIQDIKGEIFHVSLNGEEKTLVISAVSIINNSEYFLHISFEESLEPLGTIRFKVVKEENASQEKVSSLLNFSVETSSAYQKSDVDVYKALYDIALQVSLTHFETYDVQVTVPKYMVLYFAASDFKLEPASSSIPMIPDKQVFYRMIDVYHESLSRTTRAINDIEPEIMQSHFNRLFESDEGIRILEQAAKVMEEADLDGARSVSKFCIDERLFQASKNRYEELYDLMRGYTYAPDNTVVEEELQSRYELAYLQFAEKARCRVAPLQVEGIKALLQNGFMLDLNEWIEYRLPRVSHTKDGPFLYAKEGNPVDDLLPEELTMISYSTGQCMCDSQD